MDDADRHARLESWYRSDAGRVRAFLLHRTDPDTAQDVLQEVFVTAYRKAELVPDPPTGWLFATARRVLANSVRGQRRREQLAVRLDAVSERVPSAAPDTADAPDMVAAVHETLAQLSTADREVLTLSAWYELSADEAAQALGCSPSAYAVRLHRARRRFAERLRENAPGEARESTRLRAVPAEPADGAVRRAAGGVA